MNPIHAHLILNHAPIVGVLSGLLLLQWAVFKKSEELKKAALFVLVLTGLALIPVYWSGHEAAEVAVPMLQLPPLFVQRHARWARYSLIAMESLAAMSLWGLWRYRQDRPPSERLFQVAVLMAVIGFGILARTSWMGGQIRHSEIQSDWKDYNGIEGILR